MKVPHQDLCEEAEKHDRKKGTKCAFCGQYYLQDTDFYCPGCGKGRAQGERTSGDELQEKLRYISSQHERESLVINWPIPFCPKDIVSIAILAKSRYETDEELSDPFWVKYSECAEKAKLAIATAPDKTKSEGEELKPLYHVVGQFEEDRKKKEREDNILTIVEVVAYSVKWIWNLIYSILCFVWSTLTTTLKFLWGVLSNIFEWINDWFTDYPKISWGFTNLILIMLAIHAYSYFHSQDEEQQRIKSEAVVPIAKAQYDSLIVLIDDLPEPTTENARKSAKNLSKIRWTEIPDDESNYYREFIERKRHYAMCLRDVWTTKNGTMPLEIENTYNINH